jgi:hypothetical protein
VPTLKRVALLVVALGCWPPAPAGPPERSEVPASSYAVDHGCHWRTCRRAGRKPKAAGPG